MTAPRPALRVAAMAALAALVAGLDAGPLAAGPVTAAPACTTTSAAAPVKVGQIPGWAESIAVDDAGRLFATDITTGKVYRIDRPGAAAIAVTGNVKASGGILVRPDGKLLVGTQNQGPFTLGAKLLLVDPDTGAVSTYAAGLTGIDGIALAPDGTVYATTFGGSYVQRVTPGGIVETRWAKVFSPNGIAVSPDGSEVWVIQTWLAATLYRIPVNDPAHPAAWVKAAPEDALALPDGLTVDSEGRPVVSAHLTGEVWRVENGSFCALGPALPFSPQVVYGNGPTGFSAGRMYRAGAEGGIYEIPAGYDPGDR